MAQTVRDRYKLVRGIGESPSGRTFEAVDGDSGERVAVQVWNAPDGNAALVEHLQEAVSRVSGLIHPNIVRVFAAYSENRACFLVTEFLAGPTLSTNLQEGLIGLGRLKAIAEQVLDGLAYAHRQGIAHGRLRPDSIVILPHDFVKIRDFQVGGLLTREAAGTGPTTVDRLYIPQERVDPGCGSPEGDLFALGVVLYQSVAGVGVVDTSLTDSGPAALALEHFIHAGLPPSALGVGVPPDWDEFVTRAVSSDPGLRFSSAEEMVKVLSGLSSERLPLPEDGDSWEERTTATEPEDGDSGDTLVLPTVMNDFISAVAVSPASNGSHHVFEPISWDQSPPIQPEDADGWTSHDEPADSSAFTWEREADLGAKARHIPAVLVAAMAASVILACVGAFALVRASKSTVKPSAPAVPVVALNVVGPSQAHSFISGAPVTLRWSSVPGADVYLVDVAYAGKTARSATSAAWTETMMLMHTNRSQLSVLGARQYRWRVRARVHGVWEPYSAWHSFSVSPARLGLPTLLTPSNHAVLHGRLVRLCWSSVRGATNYALRVVPGRTSSLRQTCSLVSVHAGSYEWSVAATGHAATSRPGPATGPWRFAVKIPARRIALPKAKATARPAVASSLPPPAVAAPPPQSVAAPPSQSSAAPPPQSVPAPVVAQPLAPAPAAPVTKPVAPAPPAPVQAAPPAAASPPQSTSGSSSSSGSGSGKSSCIAFVNC